MTGLTSPASMIRLREQLREQADKGALKLIADSSGVSLDKLQRFAFHMSYIPLAYELRNINTALTAKFLAVPVVQYLELQTDDSVDFNPYDRRGHKL